jgi:hypothetical protein
MINIKIIDNFLNVEDFKELCTLSVKLVKNDSIDVYNNYIHNNGLIKGTSIREDTVNRLFKNYHSKAIEILKELNPKKIDLYEYSEFHIVNTGKDYKFPIHDDTPNKLLSGVIYLSPKKNSGTIFYDNKRGDNKKEVEWLENRAVFFSRSEKKTWHSFQGDGISSRLVLVYNLMTTNIKKVSEIENSNYFLTKARYLINPILYKYFKINI